jgi:hypothetical protein
VRHLAVARHLSLELGDFRAEDEVLAFDDGLHDPVDLVLDRAVLCL